MILDLLREEFERGGITALHYPHTQESFDSLVVNDGVLARVYVYCERADYSKVFVKTDRTRPFEFDLCDPASIEKIALKVLQLQRDGKW